ncbi:Disease resistance protein [Quillaja saponaria]|uniref:Disease resistance protein n=1 Tax=Quillaja saponaria TaxID=32244 RepID=A0AAD7P5E8_QUISA|nr:Disease resistance protein [Quillaja saponaria]
MCAGLRLALVTVARALTQKDISEWRDALKQLKRPHTGDTTEIQEIIESCIRLSYDRLESQELKSTFPLCASFGYSFFELDLLKHCVGLGLFKGNFTIQQAREKLETWVCKLKALSLLEADVTNDYFTMHDIVRAAAISIAFKDKHAFTMRYDKLNQWPDKDQLEHSIAITLLKSDIFPTFFNCSLELPTNSLDQCMLDDVALIGELKNLKILIFLESSIKQLPRELGLKRLEELNMENSFVGSENEGSNTLGINASVSELNCLHQLTSLDIWIRDSSILPWELFIKLKKYRILIGDVWNWSGKYMTSRTLKFKLNTSFHLVPRIKKLLERVEDLHLDELNGVTNILYELNGEGFPPLKHLLIQNNDEIEHIVNSKDPQLLRYGDVFPILESLIVHNLINLEQICISPLSATFFGKLEVIKVEGCHKLKNLSAFSMVISLKRLREIEIIACNFMEEIVILERAENCNDDIDSSNVEFHQLHFLTFQDLPDSSNLKFHQLHFLILQDLPKLQGFYFDNKISLVAEKRDTLMPLFLFLKRGIRNSSGDILSHSDGEDIFPKLETLVISNMDNFKAVWCVNQVATNSFGKMKSVEIKCCEKLLTVVPSNMLRRLQNLETLEC